VDEDNDGGEFSKFPPREEEGKEDEIEESPPTLSVF
jgi:hypothetical protein